MRLAIAAWLVVALAAGGAPAAPLDAAETPHEPPETLALESAGATGDLGPTFLSAVLSDLVEVDPLTPTQEPFAAAGREEEPDAVGDLGTPELWTTFAPAGAAPRAQTDPAPAQVLASPTALLPSSQPAGAVSGARLQGAADTTGAATTSTSSDSLLVTQAAQLPDARPVLATAAAPPRLAAMQGQGPGGNGPPGLGGGGPPGDPCSKRPGGCPPGIPEPSTAPLVATGLGLLFALTLWRRVRGAASYRKSARASSER